MNLESTAIIEAVRGGSDKILIKLYENYRDEFLSWALREHKLDADQAKDIFQDTIVAFYRNIRANASFEVEYSIKTYLFSVATNQILNLIKRQKIERNYLSDLKTFDHNPIEEHYRNEHLKVLVKRIYNGIDHSCREILMLYYEMRFDMESIANRLGYKNANVAKKKKYECMKAIEERIGLSKLSRHIV